MQALRTAIRSNRSRASCTPCDAGARSPVCASDASNVMVKLEQKPPQRSLDAVHEATKLSMVGYQGPSTTKNPKARRAPMVEGSGAAMRT